MNGFELLTAISYRVIDARTNQFKRKELRIVKQPHNNKVLSLLQKHKDGCSCDKN